MPRNVLSLASDLQTDLGFYKGKLKPREYINLLDFLCVASMVSNTELSEKVREFLRESLLLNDIDYFPALESLVRISDPQFLDQNLKQLFLKKSKEKVEKYLFGVNETFPKTSGLYKHIILYIYPFSYMDELEILGEKCLVAYLETIQHIQDNPDKQDRLYVGILLQVLVTIKFSNPSLYNNPKIKETTDNLYNTFAKKWLTKSHENIQAIQNRKENSSRDYIFRIKDELHRIDPFLSENLIEEKEIEIFWVDYYLDLPTDLYRKYLGEAPHPESPTQKLIIEIHGYWHYFGPTQRQNLKTVWKQTMLQKLGYCYTWVNSKDLHYLATLPHKEDIPGEFLKLLRENLNQREASTNSKK